MKVVITILLLLFFVPQAQATDITDIIPKQVEKAFENISADDTVGAVESLSFDRFLGLFTNTIKDCLPQFTAMLVQILVLVLLFSLYGYFSFNKTGQSYRLIIGCLAQAVLIVMLFDYFVDACRLIEENLRTICVFCDASVPVITALLVTSGKNFAAAFFSYSVSLCGTLIAALSQSIFLPLIQIMMALGCCASIWDDINFGALIDGAERFIKWSVGILFSVYSFALSMQNMLVRSSDNVTRKVIKSAAGSIPFMGKFLSEGLDGAFVIATGTKTASAVIGISVIVAIFIAPALLLAMQCVALYFSVTAARMFGQKECAVILKTVHRAYVLMLGLFLISVLMCIICFLLICLGVS